MLKNVYKVPDGKMLKIALEKEGNTIGRIIINGDFFAHPENCIETLEKELVGKELDREKLMNVIRHIVIINNFRIFGFDEKNLCDAIMGCR
ncbi:hypothetical protein JXA85_00215 [Candidatus Woesearchaeota archaeon]|nr:hypothetical protein [Candidatus Woesearchaeota archaeon]